MEYAFTSSVRGHEMIRIHFCDQTARKWTHLDIMTDTFSSEEQRLYTLLDLPEFGKELVRIRNIKYVNKKS